MAFTRFVFRRAAEKVSVVLRKDVMGVGGRGEEKVVAAGYMRNYLYPKGIAAYGTPENISAFAASESVATERARQEWSPPQERARQADTSGGRTTLGPGALLPAWRQRAGPAGATRARDTEGE